MEEVTEPDDPLSVLNAGTVTEQIVDISTSTDTSDFERIASSVKNTDLKDSSRPSVESAFRSRNAVYSTSIPSTRTHTDDGKMYTAYNICIRICGYKHFVAKRFSEFKIINDILRAEFPRVRLPNFPSKGGIGGFLTRLNDSTIENRRQNLETFLDAACAHNQMKHFNALLLFLEIQKAFEDANREVAKEVVDRLSLEDESYLMSQMQLSSKDRGYHWGGTKHSKSNNIKKLESKSYLFSHARSCAENFPPTVEAFREAIKKGRADVIQSILTEPPTFACYIDSTGQPMLHLACIFNFPQIAVMLVEHGADPDARNSRDETAYDIATDTLAIRMKSLVEILDEM